MRCTFVGMVRGPILTPWVARAVRRQETMRSYVITFESIDGDTCEVDQPARSAIDAVRAVHSGYGHFSARRSGSNAAYYQTTTAHGVITYRVRGRRITEV